MYAMILTKLKLLKRFPKHDRYIGENIFYLYTKMKDKQSQHCQDKKDLPAIIITATFTGAHHWNQKLHFKGMKVGHHE